MTGRRLLILSPAFHGYWRSYEDAFTRLGYTTRTVRYDQLNGSLAKLSHKLRVETLDRLGADGSGGWARRTSTYCANVVRSAKPDFVLVIRGDFLSSTFWDAIDDVGARTVTWFYDELRRMSFGSADAEELRRRHAIATYSSLDAHALRTHLGPEIPVLHLPLAFDPTMEYPSMERADEITFIGARYGMRAHYLQALNQAGIPVRAYGRDWSHQLVNRLRTWSWKRPNLPADSDLSRAEAYAIMCASLGTLNIHGDQDGFTMRTFEASGVGGLQLIDRDDVAELYEPGKEVLVFHNEEELIELSRRAATDTAWANKIREAGQARTLAEHTFDHRVRELAALWD